MRRPAAGVLLGLALLAGCAGEQVDLGESGVARTWGDGDYGVVLVHDAAHDATSWDEPARAFADNGMTALAVERTDAAAVSAAIGRLQADGIERVAVVAAGDGCDAALALSADAPELVDQLILLSATGDGAGLGPMPKLFVAAEDDETTAAAADELTDAAPGAWNALYLAPGGGVGQELLEGEAGADVLEAILQRLEERR